MVTLSEENYLKAIYLISKYGGESVSTNAIAERMDTKASSVTDMIKKLADKSFVNYKKYQGVRLTEKGRLAASNVVRKHRLWEVFLVDKLNFSWDEVHEVAEQLEHIKSEKLTNELDAFLEFPEEDPHGDPIPDKQGYIKNSQKVLLSQVSTGSVCICVGVKDSSVEFLQYLDKLSIGLGTVFTVASKEVFDESLTITLNESPLSVSKTVSNNLYVKIKN
ncbi:metal-dependent transcriptional regulator [Formosa sp. A9]|uniref:metal-dependent transcriptional regulator n=1 Tax=Formosa sp. A9 TaxID=3442641 RepID=UPI003EBFB8D8